MKTDYLKSVIRALEVLEDLEQNRQAGVTEIGQRLNLPKSTVHRLLSTLSSRGYVKQERSTQKYVLGVRAFEVGIGFLEQGDLLSRAIPVMKNLAKEYNLMVYLAILDKELGEVVYLYIVENESLPGIRQPVRRRAPVHCTAVGKALLSSFTEGEQQAIITKKGLPKLTGATITTVEELRRELVQIKKQGYALDRGEMHPQIRCIATLIRDTGGEAIAAISLSGLSQNESFKQIKNLANEIKEAGEEISRDLGYE